MFEQNNTTNDGTSVVTPSAPPAYEEIEGSKTEDQLIIQDIKLNPLFLK